MKRFHANHSGIKIDIGFEKLSNGLRGDISAAGERDVRVPGPQFRFQAGGQRRFLHAFVNLEKMRMTCTNADPNYFGRTFRRKCSDAGDGKKESAELNRAQFFTQR